MSRAYPPGLGRGWHTTTFRWLTIYAVIFAASVIALVGALEWSVTRSIEQATDGLMRWQLTYFDSIAPDLLPATIHRRLEHERMHTNYYGLFSSTGEHIAGDIREIPAGVLANEIGHTVDGLSITHHLRSPEARVMAIHGESGDTLIVARDLSNVMGIRRALNQTLIGGAVVCLIVGIAGGLLISVRQLRRVRDIRRVTLRIARGDLNQRLPVGGRDELDMLAHLVNHMLSEVERFMHEVKGACDGIAHDLRTPLAHIRTLLGNLEEQSLLMNDAHSASMLVQARAETDTLLGRFRAMLRISEIGALQRRGGFAVLDLQALVTDLFELYEPLAEDRGVKLDIAMPALPEGAPINGDRALLFEAFSNLMDNAIKFSPPGGRVLIRLETGSSGPFVSVSDEGPGIPVDERNAVLQRFYRSNATRHLPGVGLGLSIVTAVVRVHDFEIRIGGAASGAIMSVECWPHAFE